MVAVKLLPRVVEEYELRRAQDQVVRGVVDQVVHDAVRDRARELAMAVVDGSTSPSGVVLDRSGYTMTLPAGSTVDPATESFDQDHLTSANLRHDTTLIVVMIDDKTGGPAAFDRTVASLKSELATVTSDGDGAVDIGKVVRSVALRGKVTGHDETFDFTVSEFDGPARAYLVVAEYPDSSAADASTLVDQALGTLRLKG